MEHVARILLKQLLGQFETTPIAVSAEFKEYQESHGKYRFSDDTLFRLLQVSIDEFFRLYASRVFILVDGYDEFKCSGNEDAARADLRTSLLELCQSGSARLLITTRPQYQAQLQKAFPNSCLVNVTADMQDLEVYVEKHLRHRPLNEDLKRVIRDTVLGAAKSTKPEDRW